MVTFKKPAKRPDRGTTGGIPGSAISVRALVIVAVEFRRIAESDTNLEQGVAVGTAGELERGTPAVQIPVQRDVLSPEFSLREIVLRRPAYRPSGSGLKGQGPVYRLAFITRLRRPGSDQ